jgi:hypothetical protein
VDELVGMAPLKSFLHELRSKVEYVERGGDPRLLEGCLNIVLTGNPGAGETTAARLLVQPATLCAQPRNPMCSACNRVCALQARPPRRASSSAPCVATAFCARRSSS